VRLLSLINVTRPALTEASNEIALTARLSCDCANVGMTPKNKADAQAAERKMRLFIIGKF
jgi:hypothetical protein